MIRNQGRDWYCTNSFLESSLMLTCMGLCGGDDVGAGCKPSGPYQDPIA